MEDYVYLTTIGEGAYSVVYKCKDNRNGQLVAIKSFKHAHELKEVCRLAEREVSVLRSIRHPSLVELQAAFRSPRGRIYLVFPYYGVSAYQLLRAYQKEQLQQQGIERQLIGLGGGHGGGGGGLPAVELKLLAWQMLQALSYLHTNQIVHRDVKPSNVLLCGDGVARLCDFGFARPTGCGPLDVQRMSSYVVTRWYRAPEVLVGDLYGPSSDVWSLGCTLAELAAGEPLFPGDSTADQLWRIMRCFGPLPEAHLGRMAAHPLLCSLPTPSPGRTLRERLPRVDRGLFRLIEACLQPDPHARPTAARLLQDLYFHDVDRLLAGTAIAAAYEQHRRGEPQPQPQPQQQQAVEVVRQRAPAAAVSPTGALQQDDLQLPSCDPLEQLSMFTTAAAVAAAAASACSPHGSKVHCKPHVPPAAAAAVAAPETVVAEEADYHRCAASGPSSDSDKNNNAAVGGRAGSSSNNNDIRPCQQQGTDAVLGGKSEASWASVAGGCPGAVAAEGAFAVATATAASLAASNAALVAAARRAEGGPEQLDAQGSGAGGVRTGAGAVEGAAAATAAADEAAEAAAAADEAAEAAAAADEADEAAAAVAAVVAGAAAELSAVEVVAAAVAAAASAPLRGSRHRAAESTVGGGSGPLPPPAKQEWPEGEREQELRLHKRIDVLLHPFAAASHSPTPQLGSSSSSSSSGVAPVSGLQRVGSTGSTDQRPSPRVAAAALAPTLPTPPSAPGGGAPPAQAERIASGSALPLPLLSHVAFHGATGEDDHGQRLQQAQQQQQQHQMVVRRSEEPEPTPFAFQPTGLAPNPGEPCFSGLPFGEVLERPEPTPQSSPLSTVRLLRGAMLDAQMAKPQQQQQQQQQLVPRARARSVEVPGGAAAQMAVSTLAGPHVPRTSDAHSAHSGIHRAARPSGTPGPIPPLSPGGQLLPVSGWLQAPPSTTPSGTIARLEGGPMAPMLAAVVLGERKIARQSVDQRLYGSAGAGRGGGGSSGGNQSWSGAESEGQQHHTRTVSGPCTELLLAGSVAATAAYHGPTSAGAHSAGLPHHRVQAVGLSAAGPAPQRAGPAVMVVGPLSGCIRRRVARRPSRLSLDQTSRPPLQRVTGPLPVCIPEMISSGPSEPVQDAAAKECANAPAGTKEPGGGSAKGPRGLRRLQAWLFPGRNGIAGLAAPRAVSSWVERIGQGRGSKAPRLSDPGHAGVATAAAALGQPMEGQLERAQREAEFLATGDVGMGLGDTPVLLSTRASIVGGSMMTAHSSPLPVVSSFYGVAHVSPCASGQATPLRTSRTAASPAAIAAAAAIRSVAQTYSNKLIKLPETSPVLQGAGEELPGPEPGRHSAPGTAAAFLVETGDSAREPRPCTLAAAAPQAGLAAARMSYGGPFGAVGAEQEGACGGSVTGSRRLQARSSGKLGDQQLQLIHVQLHEQARAVGTTSGSAGPASSEAAVSGGDTLAELPDSQPPPLHARWPGSFKQLALTSSASVSSSTAGAAAAAGPGRLLGPARTEGSVTSSRGPYGRNSSVVTELTRGASSKVLGLAAEAVATPSLYRDSSTLASTMGPGANSGPLGLSSGMSVTGVPYGVHLSYRGSSSVAGAPNSAEAPAGGATVGAGMRTTAGRQHSGGGGVPVPDGRVNEEGGKRKGGLAKAKGLLKKVARALGVKGDGSAR